MNKKLLQLLLVFGTSMVLAACQGGEMGAQPERQEGVSDEGVETAINGALVVVDFGDEAATYSASVVEGSTVLDMLIEVMERAEMEYELEHYDFGDLVISIDGVENSMEKAWIYFVNGQAGEVGAGDREVVSGDRIEWRYIEPVY